MNRLSELITQSDFIALLRTQAPHGQQGRWSLANGVEPSVLSDVLNGRRDPGKSILRALGYERVVLYRKIGERE